VLLGVRSWQISSQVGEELLGCLAANTSAAPFAARSGRSGGCDALLPTPATQLQRYLSAHAKQRGNRRRRSRLQLGEAAQVLGDGCQRELELSSARSAQA